MVESGGVWIKEFNVIREIDHTEKHLVLRGDSYLNILSELCYNYSIVLYWIKNCTSVQLKLTYTSMATKWFTTKTQYYYLWLAWKMSKLLTVIDYLLKKKIYIIIYTIYLIYCTLSHCTIQTSKARHCPTYNAYRTWLDCEDNLKTLPLL